MRFGTLVAGLAVIGWSTGSAQSAADRQLGLVEELRIDGNDHEWSRIEGIHLAPNGNIFVRNRGDFAMSLFSPTGRLIKQFANKGDGPGEVRAATNSGIVGDSLYIVESGARRISLFGLDGSPGRTITPMTGGEWLKNYPPAANYVSQILVPNKLLPGNVGLGGGLIESRRVGPNGVNSISLFRMAWDGVPNSVLLVKPFGRFNLRVEVPGMPGSVGRQAFVNDPTLVYSPSGLIAIVDAEEKPSPSIVINYLTIKGDTTRRVRVPYTPMPVTSTMVDSAVTQLAKSMHREGHEDLIRKALVVPKYDWPIGQTALADDGTTWIQIKGNTPTADWLVISPQGKHIGTVRLPRNAEVQLLQKGIWVVVKDENDVPSVVRYRLK